MFQAPIPELAQLRQGPGWLQHGLRVTSEAAEHLKAPPCAPALDIELTIDRWDSMDSMRGWVLGALRALGADSFGSLPRPQVRQLPVLFRNFFSAH